MLEVICFLVLILMFYLHGESKLTMTAAKPYSGDKIHNDVICKGGNLLSRPWNASK